MATGISWLEEMKLVRLLAVFLVCLFISAPVFADGMPQEWKMCTQDSVCRIIGGGCFLDAVNLRFVTHGTQYANDINARIECFRYMDPLKARAVCDFSNSPVCGPNESCPAPRGLCRAVEG